MKKKFLKLVVACMAAAFAMAPFAGTETPLGKIGGIVANAAGESELKMVDKGVFYKGEVFQFFLYNKELHGWDTSIEKIADLEEEEKQLNAQAQWRSKNPRVLIVDSHGRAKAKQTGVASIICKYGGKTYERQIYVKRREMYIGYSKDFVEQGLGLSEKDLKSTSMELQKGSTFGLAVYEAGNWKIKWSSTNKKVASVNSDGVVRAKREGYTDICAKIKGKTLKCRVIVRMPKKEKEKKDTVTYKKSKTLTVPNATSKTQWYTSHPDYISLSNKRGKKTTIKILKTGSYCAVYARTPGKRTYRFYIECGRISNPVCGAVNDVKVGDTFVLTTLQNIEKPRWSSSDPKIASIDRNGRVKVKRKGLVTLSCHVDGWRFDQYLYVR